MMNSNLHLVPICQPWFQNRVDSFLTKRPACVIWWVIFGWWSDCSVWAGLHYACWRVHSAFGMQRGHKNAPGGSVIPLRLKSCSEQLKHYSDVSDDCPWRLDRNVVFSASILTPWERTFNIYMYSWRYRTNTFITSLFSVVPLNCEETAQFQITLAPLCVTVV